MQSLDIVERSTLPKAPKQKTPYRVENGIIESQACEINIVDHCNYSCRACSHLSPISENKFVNLDHLDNDLNILSRYYRVEVMRLVGGEPLLHPELLEIIRIVRESNISKQIHIITNGSFLDKMPIKFWDAIDKVNVSVYGRKSDIKLNSIIKHDNRFNSKVSFIKFQNFRESYSELGTINKRTISRIYKTCQIAHIWRCHTLANGILYRCPQSYYLPLFINNPKLTNCHDGIKIKESHDFVKQLIFFFENPDPLSSCSFCLGSVGKIIQHEQIPRSTWRNYQMKPSEDMVDWAFLKRLEVDPDAYNNCYEKRKRDNATR